MMAAIDEIPGKNPFRVPDNYFEDFNRRIISETSGKKAVSPEPDIFRKLRPYLAVAAAAAAVIVLGYFTIRHFSPLTSQDLAAEISLQELSDAYLDDIDIITLEQSAAAYLFTEDVPGVSDTEIIDYLLLENIEINEIYELL